MFHADSNRSYIFFFNFIFRLYITVLVTFFQTNSIVMILYFGRDKNKKELLKILPLYSTYEDTEP